MPGTGALRRRTTALLAALAAIALTAPGAWADGELDPSFDGDGRVLSDPTEYNERVTDMAIDAQGRIVLTVVGEDPGKVIPNRAIVARFNPDGSLDKSFDGDGTVFVFWVNGQESINGVAIDSVGRIVVAGSAVAGPSGLDLAAARFLPNGEPDQGFGDNGQVTFQPPEGGGTDSGTSVAVDAQDRVLVGGHSTEAVPNITRFALVRFDASGDPDKSFSGDGAVLTDFPGANDAEANALEIDALGRPALAGRAVDSADNAFAVARYDGSGNLDPSFDGDGRATLDFDSLPEEGMDLEIDPEGRLVIAGHSRQQVDSVLELGRLLPGGAPDAGFGGDGTVTTDRDEQLLANGLAIDPAGRLVVAGVIGDFITPDAQVARYLPDGALDPGFGAGGMLREDFLAPDARGEAVAVDSLGRYVVAGTAETGDARSIGLARFLAIYPVSAAVSAPAGRRCKGKPATMAGTRKRDRLKGTKRRDVIAALGGNDIVRGLGGNDLICAGAGRDLIRAGAGRDLVRGEGGNDRLFGQAGKDRLLGQKGRDLLAGGPGRDKLRGGPGRDRQR